MFIKLLLFHILVKLNSFTNAGCPFVGIAYQKGQRHAYEIQVLREKLLAQNDVVLDPEPGSLFFSNFLLSDKLQDDYNHTNALIFAQQELFSKCSPYGRPFTSDDKKLLLQSLTEDIPLQERCKNVDIKCDENKKYSRIGGVCNNLKNPKLGTQFTSYSSLFPPLYDDGINQIRKSISKQELPSPRKISNDVLQQSTFNPIPDKIANIASLMFGQFITHDIGFVDHYQNVLGGYGLRCCPADCKSFNSKPETGYYGCLPIEVPNDDPVLSPLGIKCINYIRAQPTLENDCSVGPARPSNAVSHYLDVSNIYGSNDDIHYSVRSFVSGKLLTDKMNIMPITPDCTGDCYFTGDYRAPIYPALGLLHSIFIRFHNIVAGKLEIQQNLWNDEEIFQQARRIVTAIYQNIVYYEWLPIFLGEKKSEKYNLTCSTQQCGEYNSNINPSALTDFSSGAFRKFHENTPDRVNGYNSDYKLMTSRTIPEMIVNFNYLAIEYNDLLRGLVIDPVVFDSYHEMMRNRLFNSSSPLGLGIDLLSMDIIKGRDNGLSPYYVYVEMVFPDVFVKDFDDLEIVISKNNIEKLKRTYVSVYDVDLFVGTLLEEKNAEYSGPIAVEIIGKQFYNLKYGDRFFFQHNNFTENQLAEISRYKIANIFCETTDVKEMVANGFLAYNENNNRFIDCNKMLKLDIRAWEMENP